ncbi:heme-thiolate peroxidase aromatic peroxygenase like protein [Rutstroemia sp. NJR-2017a BBW]|nr:heme-thiolate peroxidase aromatic peroxygenase like protein [Rutstroemia sp. NJR-2017a BBW]
MMTETTGGKYDRNAQKNSDGSYSFNNQERIPDNWTNRATPYTAVDVTVEILAQYLEYPVLFGGATGNGGFDTINFGSMIKDGKLISPPDAATSACFLYQLATQSIPSSLNGVVTPTVQAITLLLSKLGTTLTNLGCPIALT